MKIAVTGHICLDIIPNWQEESSLDYLKPGHIVEMKGIDISLGGAVSNTGLALSKLGFPVKLLGKVGKDSLGEIVESKIKKNTSNGDESKLVKSDKSNTSYTIVLSPPDTDRLFLHDPGLNNNFTSQDVDFSQLDDCEVFHFGYPPIMKNIYQNQGQELLNLFQNAKKNNLITSLDLAMPDPSSPSLLVDWKKIFTNTLPLVDIFMPSLEELLFILDRKEYQEIFVNNTKEISGYYLNDISNKLLEFGSKIIVLKLGEKGIYLRTGQFNTQDFPLFDWHNLKEWSNRRLYSSNFKAQTKGTTGAGDCAVAGFLTGLLQKRSPEQALNLAAASGACCVEEIDAISGLKSLEKIEKRIEYGWERHTKEISLKKWQKKDSGVWEQSL